MADTHVGFAAYNRLTPDGLNQREQDAFDAFSRALAIARAERVDAVVHAGDVFDSVRPTNRAVAFVLDEVRRLAADGIAFVAISGNHETPRLRETGSVFRLFDFLPSTFTAYKSRYEVKRVKETAFHLVPHCASQEAFEAELAKAAPDAAARFNVLVLHGGVVGVGAFAGSELNELTVPAAAFEGGWDYVALGHYHKPTEVGPRVAYAGSTERFSFGEIADAKSVLVVDLAKGARRGVPVAGRAMLDLPTVDASTLSEIEVGHEILRRLRDAPLDGSIARLRVRKLASAAYAALDFEAIRKATASAVHFVFEPEIVRAGASREGGESLGRLDREFEDFAAAAPLGEDAEAVRALGARFLAEAAGLAQRAAAEVGD